MLFLNELRPGKNESVPDPWFGTDSDYYLVYEIIEEACFKIIEKYTETS
jgi:protein-tyrosine phosphatase